MNYIDCLIRPIFSEKSQSLQQNSNVFCFYVDIKATKEDIRQAVEKFFEVKVEKIATLKTFKPEKVVRLRRGQRTTKPKLGKKAYVYLQAGKNIDFEKFSK